MPENGGAKQRHEGEGAGGHRDPVRAQGTAGTGHRNSPTRAQGDLGPFDRDPAAGGPH